MKILHVCKKYPNALGGDAVVVSNLQKQQEQAGHQVAILTSNCAEIISGPHIYTFGLRDTPAALDAITPRRLVSLATLFFKAFRVLRRERPDVIHTHSPDMAYVVGFAARWYDIPLIHTCHIVTFNDPQQPAIRRKSELFFVRGAKPAVVTAPNAYEAAALQQAGVADAVCIPNGVALEDWQVRRSAPDGPAVFMAVGRLEDQKGFSYLVRAAALLRAQTDQPFTVQILGDGSQRSALEALARELGMADCVQLVGRKETADIKRLAADATAMVIPSLWETTPLTLLEAWAMRLPVISTPTGILRAETTGRVAAMADCKDAESLAAAMQRILEDPAYRQQLASAGYDEVARLYTWQMINKDLSALYARVHS